MPELNLDQLDTLLLTHFAGQPPIDGGYYVGVSEPSSFTTVRLGDGKREPDGTDYLFVYEIDQNKRVTQKSLTQWLKDTPQKDLAPKLNELLQSGQIAYHENGREFISTLHMDPKTNQLTTKTLTPDKPVSKPHRSILQWFKDYFFDSFRGPDRDAYDKQMIAYKIDVNSRALAESRASNRYVEEVGPDGKGKVIAQSQAQLDEICNYLGEPKALRQARIKGNVAWVLKRKQESKEFDEKIRMRSSIPKPTDKMIEELEAKPTFKQLKKEGKALNVIYLGKIPKGINTLAQHRDAVIKRQDSLPLMQDLKANLEKKTLPEQVKMAAEVVRSVMGLAPGTNSECAQTYFELERAHVFLDIVVGDDFPKLVQENKFLDKFAENLNKAPDTLSQFGAEEVRKLLGHCVKPYHELGSKVLLHDAKMQDKAIHEQHMKELQSEMAKPKAPQAKQPEPEKPKKAPSMGPK